MKIVFYAYLINDTVRHNYHELWDDICKYIRDRNGHNAIIIGSLSNMAKYISFAVEAYDDEEELVWDNAAEAVYELNRYFMNEAVIFSQFEGYRFDDIVDREAKRAHMTGDAGFIIEEGIPEDESVVRHSPWSELAKKPVIPCGEPKFHENKEVCKCDCCKEDEKLEVTEVDELTSEMQEDIMRLCEKWFGREKANS